MNTTLLRILTFAISSYAVTSQIDEIDLYVFLHIIIIGVSSFSLYSYSDKPFTLHKVYYIFVLFFFGIAPVLQYHENTRFLGELSIPYEIKIKATLIVLFTTVFYSILYSIFYRMASIARFKNLIVNLSLLKRGNNVLKGKTLFLITLSLISLLMVLYINNFNYLKLFFRGGEFVTGASTTKVNKTMSLIGNQFFRPLSLTVFIISYTYNRSQKLLNLVLFLIFFITCCPTALARNATAGFYLPLLLLFVPIFQKRHFFVSSMLAGLLIVFPFLNNFRRFSGDTKFEIALNYDMFTDMHFDAYLTLCRILNLDIVTYGNQLLGVLFFFVPRSIWSSKPQSSGWMHAEELQLWFKNLACTYYAEGYVNFGYFGILLFLILIAWFSAYLDKVYWSFKKVNSYFNVIYVLILGMFLFVLRGDLMNGFSYTFGLVFTAIITYKIVVFISKIKV